MTAALFQKLEFAGLTFDNRIVIAPMCQYSAEAGSATDWHMIHLGHLALSGASLLILEATAVEDIGRITPADLGLYSDANEAALARVVKAIRAYSPIKLGLQLGHAGRKASSRAPWDGGKQLPIAEGGWRTAAPSTVALNAGEELPAALDTDGLARVRDAFVATALRAERLGFELLELHGAHGYLLHQFLSPLSNQRNDEYGGSLEGRMRFPLDVFAAVRKAVPKLAVGIRISATDWVPGGWDLDQSVVFADRLKAMGCDFIDVSTGGLSSAQQIPLGPNYQVPFAARIKAAVGMPTMAVGLITEPTQADAVVANGEADMVALARGILYDPRWPWHAAAQLGAEVSAPKQYWRSQPRDQKALFGATTLGQR